MKKSNCLYQYCKYVFSTAFFILICATISAESGPFTSLTLTLSSETTRCLPMEPIEVVLQIKNNTNINIDSHGALGLEYDFTEYLVRYETGAFKIFRQEVSTHVTTVGGHYPMKPNEFASTNEILSFEWGGKRPSVWGAPGEDGNYMFDRPGTYQIKATVKKKGVDVRIESNVINVEVSPPLGIDAEALNFLQNHSHLENILVRVVPPIPAPKNSEEIQTLKKLLDLYPNSTYAKYAGLTLGRFYYLFSSLGMSSEGEAIFEKIEPKDKSWIKREVLWYLVKYNSKEKNAAKAMKYFNEFEEVFPGSKKVKYLERHIGRAFYQNRPRQDWNKPPKIQK